MSVYTTSVQTTLYVAVPKSLFIDLQNYLQDYDRNLDKSVDDFVEANEEIQDPVFDEILENALNLGIDGVVVYQND